MRTFLHPLVLILFSCLFAAAQSGPNPPSTAKPPVRTPASSATIGEPIAIIHTTAGDLHCTLFPKVAPIGVENFIGLAGGTKDWTLVPAARPMKFSTPIGATFGNSVQCKSPAVV